MPQSHEKLVKVDGDGLLLVQNMLYYSVEESVLFRVSEVLQEAAVLF